MFPSLQHLSPAAAAVHQTHCWQKSQFNYPRHQAKILKL